MNPTTTVAQSPATLKWLWAAVGVLGVSVLALGGTLLTQKLHDEEPAATQAAVQGALAGQTTLQRAQQGLQPQALVAPDAAAVRNVPQPGYQQPYQQPYAQPQQQQPRRGDPYMQPAAQGREAAPPCRSCGRVVAVHAIEQGAPATGLGAVAGGVLGGVLGNQIGKGSGRTAATVLGAVGGGYVGHKVEERVRSTTVYQMRVRMDDGAMRSFTRAQPVAEGTPVRLEGKSWRVDDGAGAVEQRPGAQPVYVNERTY
ncbi:MAG: glycine zipper 2TM domain-containing protein [Proteobacteria bacterium]|nr:glycine zipper 2TM domain-containing protein [Pseudomonadota bacterium]